MSRHSNDLIDAFVYKALPSYIGTLNLPVVCKTLEEKAKEAQEAADKAKAEAERTAKAKEEAESRRVQADADRQAREKARQELAAAKKARNEQSPADVADVLCKLESCRDTVREMFALAGAMKGTVVTEASKAFDDESGSFTFVSLKEDALRLAARGIDNASAPTPADEVMSRIGAALATDIAAALEKHGRAMLAELTAVEGYALSK